MRRTARVTVTERVDGPGADRSTGGPPPVRLVRDRVFEALREAIQFGRIAPGTRLTERALCDEYGISRTVVRETMRRLESERLVDVTAHAGVRVAVLTPQRVREIYEIRTELEVIIVRSFIAAAEEADMAALDDLQAEIEAAAAERDKEGLVAIATRWLRHMVGVADNQVAAELLDHLLARINMLRILAMSEPGQIEASIADIGEVMDALRARDTDRAEAAVRAQVTRAYRAGLRHLEAGGA